LRGDGLNGTPTTEHFKIQQLEEELERKEETHKKEIQERESEIKELKGLLKIKQRIESVTHAEYTLEYFPKFVIGMLKGVDESGSIRSLYLNAMSFINLAIVSGIGFLIYIYASRLIMKPVAAIIGFVIFWNLSAGPLGYVFGLAPRTRRKKQT